MKNILKWLLYIEILIYGCYGLVTETEDAIIIEVDDTETFQQEQSNEKLIRNRRQLFYTPPQLGLYRRQSTWKDVLGEGKSCITSRGHLGQCTSFRQCYPYFKIPDLSVWESWVLGNYDSCSYYNDDGRQAYGVCCTNPITESPPTDDQENVTENSNESVTPTLTNKVPYPNNNYPPWFNQGTMNWPPQSATHPPNHTAATHPPSTTLQITTPKTTWPTKATTKNPWYQPPTTTTTQKPHEGNHHETTGCGIKNGSPFAKDQERIVGGTSAQPNEWPWAAVFFNGGRQFCGGSLISDRNLLTAAHCVVHMTAWDVQRLRVRLGDHNIKSDTEVKHVERKIKRLVRHRGFDSRTLFHDVAVLTMDQPVEFSRTIKPVCLPNPSKTYNGHTATVVGWGSLRENGPQPALLQEVEIPIWTNSECRIKYGAAAPGGIDDGMLCAGQAARDSCSGDSGGPLVVYDNNRWVQVGIVSWGIGCGKGQYPGVYSRVTHYLPWILKNSKE